ncbi:MAG TPA: ribosome biogenesis factor YjgA [Steroidobacteraceae bacterium]|nr:ribosome biogenesis factor YjgA [Steroidobacteraceae bacterium]
MTMIKALDEPPSRSARKRSAEAAQALGEALIALTDVELAALELPERLVTAIREARSIRSRSASARQRQYIGRLMREIDPKTVEAALAVRRERAALEALRFKRLESWRARLLADDTGAALSALAVEHPQIERGEWARAIAAARAARGRERGADGAARRLFRMLRALLEGERRA